LKTQLWAVKIILASTKVRILYFDSELEADEWTKTLKEVVGIKDLDDFYEMGKFLGSGQFGVVSLATHKVSRQ
jgi:hypothetical protein